MSTKRWLVLAVAVFAAAGCGKKDTSLRLAFVNVTEVFDAYEKTKIYDESFRTAGESKKSEHTRLVEEVRKLEDEISLASQEKKAAKQKELDKKREALVQFRRSVEDSLGRERERVMKEILEDLNRSVIDYGRRRGFDFVFNERVALYRRDAFDVTEDIIQDMNARFDKERKKDSSAGVIALDSAAPLAK